MQINSRIISLKAMSSADNDNRITADDGCSTTIESVVAVEDPALPGELVLGGRLTSHYPGVDETTT